MDPQNEGLSIDISSMRKDAHPMADSKDCRRPKRIQVMLQNFEESLDSTTTSIAIKSGAQDVLETREQDIKEVPLNLGS